MCMYLYIHGYRHEGLEVRLVDRGQQRDAKSSLENGSPHLWHMYVPPLKYCTCMGMLDT